MTSQRASEWARIYSSSVFYVWITLAGLMMCAGGLGLAATSASMALFWLPFLLLPAYYRISRQPAAIVLGGVAVGWTLLSFAWSPYDRPDQAIKLALLTPLFALLPFAITLLSDDRRQRFAKYTAYVFLSCGIFFLIEGVSDAWLSTIYKLRVEGYDNHDIAQPLAERALSRGASAFLLAAGPIAIWMWMHHQSWRWPAICLAFSMGIAASAFNVEANILALSAGMIAGIFSVLWPKRCLQFILAFAAIWVLSAPVSMSILLGLVPDSLANSLPLSWQMRLEIWDRAISFISQAPVFGHGLDASRVLSATASIDGFTFEALPLHPHNLGLQIWIETGAVGAGLFAVTLVGVAFAIERHRMASPVRLGITYCVTAWLVMVMVGYGIWQEWHHGALALGLAMSWFNATPR